MEHIMTQSELQKALGERATFKKRKPSFSRQDAHKKKRLGWAWRKPKGLQSKMRLRLKHHKRVVKIGYKSPQLAHGYSPQGFMPRHIETLVQVALLQKGDGAIIARTTSLRTKLILIKACEEKGIPILNVNVSRLKAEEDRLASQRAEHKKTQEAKKDEKSSAKKEDKKATKQSSQVTDKK